MQGKSFELKKTIGSLIFKPFVYIILICILILSCGQNKRGPFSTYYDHKSFSDSLKEKENLLILSFSVDPILYTEYGKEFDIYPGFMKGLESTIAKKRDPDQFKNEVILMTETINKNFYQEFTSVFAEKFNIIGSTNYENVSFPINDTLQIKQLIRTNDAKYGIRIHSQFGAKWAQKNTGIEAYYYRFSVNIYNCEGQKVWSFCGKGYKLELLDISLQGLVDGFTAKLSLETIVKGFKGFTYYSPRLLMSLIEDDVLGKEHGKSLYNYYNNKDMKLLGFYNCDENELPHFNKTVYDE